MGRWHSAGRWQLREDRIEVPRVVCVLQSMRIMLALACVHPCWQLCGAVEQ